MRFGMLIIVLAAGCTHLALERRTVKQAATLADLQSQQVLDNLAMFASNPQALPWHLKLKDGLVQVTDQASGGITGVFSWPRDVGSSVSPNISAQRAVVGQWSGEPAIGADDLELLALAYQKAVMPVDAQLDKEIRLKIWKLVVTCELAPGSDVVLDVMTDAVRDESDRLERELNRLRMNEISDDRVAAIRSIKAGFERLESIVNGERTGEFYKTPDEMRNDVRALAYGNFQEAHAYLSSALAGVPAGSENHKILTEAMHRTAVFLQEEGQERLVDALLRLNPFREAARKRMQASSGQTSHEFRDVDPYVSFLIIAGSDRYLNYGARRKPGPRNAGLIDEAEDKVAAQKQLLTQNQTGLPWFSCGGKKDVPRNACFIGHYSCGGRDLHVWVTEDHMQDLKEFTLKVLTLAPIKEQDTPPGRGAAFSPGK